jgi:hypothetical protein
LELLTSSTSILNGEGLANSAEMGLFLVRVVTFLRLTCSNVDAQRRGVPSYRSANLPVELFSIDFCGASVSFDDSD